MQNVVKTLGLAALGALAVVALHSSPQPTQNAATGARQLSRAEVKQVDSIKRVYDKADDLHEMYALRRKFLDAIQYPEGATESVKYEIRERAKASSPSYQRLADKILEREAEVFAEATK